MIGGVGRIKGPFTCCLIEGQPWDVGAKELIGECVVGISVVCCELAGDDGSVFFCCLSSGEGGRWSVVGTCEGDVEGAGTCGLGSIGDGVLNSDGLSLVLG